MHPQKICRTCLLLVCLGLIVTACSACTRQKQMDLCAFCLRVQDTEPIDGLQPTAFVLDTARSTDEQLVYHGRFQMQEIPLLLTCTAQPDGTLHSLQLTALAQKSTLTQAESQTLYRIFCTLCAVLHTRSVPDEEDILREAGIVPEQLQFVPTGFVGTAQHIEYACFAENDYVSLFCTSSG